MNYLALARAYRPRKFAELVGQNHVVLALENALKQKRLHHAYLFTGTRGVGKTTIARILAKSLNCIGVDGKGDVTAEPCGQCAACSQIDEGRFADYIELDAASNRGVDEIQQLLEQAVYKPVQGRYKVFMIDEVHMMTNHAFNAMLKTLEEPPEYLKFVLATTDPQKVPVTVLSRCLQFNLRPIAADVISEFLAGIMQQEKVTAEPAALALLAKNAKGSMRDALSLTDQAIAYGQGAVMAQAVRQMLGAVDVDYIYRLIAALAADKAQEVVDIVRSLQEQGMSAHAALVELIDVCQQMTICQLTAGGSMTGNPPGSIVELAGLLAADETQLLYNFCLHGQQELELAPDEYGALAMVLLRLLAFKNKADKAVARTTTEVKQTTKESIVKPSAPTSEVNKIAGAVDVPKVACVTVTEQEIKQKIAPSAKPIKQERLQVSAEQGIENSVTTVTEAAKKTPSVTSSGNEGLGANNNQAELADFWCNLIIKLGQQKKLQGLAKQLACNSQLVSQQEQIWQLVTQRSSLVHNTASLQTLNQLLVENGYEVQLQVALAPDNLSPLDTVKYRLQQKQQQQSAQAKQRLLADEYIRTTLENFGAAVDDAVYSLLEQE